MSNGSSSAGGGVSFIGLLTLLFVAFKLLGVVTWPWWAVLLPLWAPFAVVAVVFLGVVLVAVIK